MLCQALSGGGDACVRSFDLAALRATPLNTKRFKYAVVPQMVPPGRLRQILADFPAALTSTKLADKKNVEAGAVA